jgi:hypothetical protein
MQISEEENAQTFPPLTAEAMLGKGRDSVGGEVLTWVGRTSSFRPLYQHPHHEE